VYAGLDGVKTGHTDLAGWNLVASAARGGVKLYCVVLGSPTQARRDADVARLLDWGFDRFHHAVLVARGAAYGDLAAPYGLPPVPVVAGRSLALTAQPGERFSERVVLPDRATLPVRAGQRVGTLTVRAGSRTLATLPLVAARSAGRPSAVTKARWLAGRIWHHLLGAL
jgi:D-alanyl-D-alanine carboxypeptidase (penicillin-binding protein 5/6)